MSGPAIGHIPKGWKRGDKLRVQQLTNNPVYRAIIRNGELLEIDSGAAIVADTVEEIRIPHDEWTAAQAWIAWWNAPAVSPYGCHNRPRPTAETSHVAQAGWREYEERGAPVRVPVYITIPHVMSTTCQYDKAATDAKCAGCAHAGGGAS